MKLARQHPAKVKGTAIFMALLIIAIVTAIATALMSSQQINIRRTQMMLTSEQAYLYAQGVNDWAISKLRNDLTNPQANPVWPLVLRPTTIANGQGKISGVLQDAQSLFNLNNFSQNPMTNPAATQGKTETAAAPKKSADNQLILKNLFTALNLQLPEAQQLLLIEAIRSWVSFSAPAGALNPTGIISTDTFDQQYAQFKPGYRSPHAPMAGISEFRTVTGMTPQIYNRLSPYLVALPTSTQINPQHAPPAILQALGLPANYAQSNPAGQSNASQYFLLRADVYLDTQHLVVYSLYFRNNTPNKSQITMLWQSFGTM